MSIVKKYYGLLSLIKNKNIFYFKIKCSPSSTKLSANIHRIKKGKNIKK
jgi:hypothetical protein